MPPVATPAEHPGMHGLWLWTALAPRGACGACMALVHAGMGRAPAVALAYMWWVQGMHLEDAFEVLVAKRWCAPALWAVRQAAADMLYGGHAQEYTIRKKGSSNSSVVEIAGTLPCPVQFVASSAARGTAARGADGR
jgi:hypothetical protein